MLNPQQSRAKEAARRHFSHPRLGAQSDRPHGPDDALPNFALGVVGIGIAGEYVRVYLLRDDETLAIPDRFEGLPTVRVLTSGILAYAPDRQRPLEPVPGGVSVAHSSGTAGTLGCLVDIPGSADVPGSRRCILSNNHVLAATNQAALGDPILQPGPKDGTSANPPRQIAQLLAWEKLNVGGGVNQIDAAIAEIVDDQSVTCSPEIMTLGPPVNPPIPGRLGQNVAKHGRTTGLTFGTIVDVSFDGFVNYFGHPAYFEHQIAIEGDRSSFSEPGDSGSLIVASATSQPVALLFAGDGSLSYANPIDSVLNCFGATVAT